MKLTIDRRRWIRENYDDGRGQHCAIGFYQCSPAYDANTMKLMEDTETECPQCGIRESVEHCILHANDSLDDGLQREMVLADLFGRVGVDVEYIG